MFADYFDEADIIDEAIHQPVNSKSISFIIKISLNQ